MRFTQFINQMLQDYSDEEVSQLLEKHYGLKGSIKQLGSYEDRNFLLKTSEHNEKYIVKISMKVKDENLILLQNYVFKKLAAEKSYFKCKFPQLIFTKNNEDMLRLESKQGNNYIRVLSYIEGEEMYDIEDPQLHLFDEAGQLAGKISIFFDKLSKEQQVVQLNKKIKQESHSFNLLSFNQHYNNKHKYLDPNIKPIVDKIKNEFNQVLPILQGLPKQLIHHDICLTNLLVSQQNGKHFISGLIDFSDVFETHGIIQLVILGARINLYRPQPLRNMLRTIASFNRVRKLSQQEKKILFPLIKTRLAFLSMTSSYLASSKNNDPYFQKCKNGHLSYLVTFYEVCSNQQFLKLLEDILSNE